MPRAIISVYDKTDLIPFATALSQQGWDLVASGGTAKHLEAAGLSPVPIERVTQTPEMLGGRVKTLHPAVHGGILARESDMDELAELGIAPIDLVVCNLYPFQAVTSQADVSLEAAIEHIDIGGVTLLRAAAKNFQRVTVVVVPSDYERVLAALQEGIPVEMRRELALKAFAHTRDYDTAIHAYLAQDVADVDFGETFAFAATQTQTLRYGENPHQRAGFFAQQHDTLPLGGELLAGKPLSYNNILDADAAWAAASAFDPQQSASVVIVKHLTPTGVAIGATPAAAFPFALESDALSAFGGVIAVNHAVDIDFVNALENLFVEVLIAPDFTADARDKLQSGRKNCRLIRMADAPAQPKAEFRSVLGGVLVQERDNGDPASMKWNAVTERRPSESETEALEFAWRVVQHVKSNAIVLARQGATVGIGGGLPSRVDAVKLAIEKAGKQSHGAALASDAFFPFPDAIEEAAKAGITAIIQPGGALRDQQVIDAANAANIAMIFTGTRHFRH